MEDGSSYRRYLCYVSIYENFWPNAAGPTFSTTVCILRSSVMHRLSFRLPNKVSSEVWQHTHSDDVGIGQQHAHWHQSEPADQQYTHWRPP